MTIEKDATDSVGAADVDTTVLFVDDEPTILLAYESLFAKYDVLTAKGGKEALETFGDHVDIAFIDRRMPDVSGDETIRTLRERGYDTPLMILSAVDPKEDPAVEYQEYLNKPINRTQILTVLDRYTG